MIFETRKLSKSFGGLTAVHEVDLQVRHGELVSIIGPNGAGKTTLFNLLTGHLPADSGGVFFKGTNITRLPPHAICRMGIGRSFQRLNIFPRLSTFENVQVAVFSSLRKSHLLFSRAGSWPEARLRRSWRASGSWIKRTRRGGCWPMEIRSGWSWGSRWRSIPRFSSWMSRRRG